VTNSPVQFCLGNFTKEGFRNGTDICSPEVLPEPAEILGLKTFGLLGIVTGEESIKARLATELGSKSAESVWILEGEPTRSVGGDGDTMIEMQSDLAGILKSVPAENNSHLLCEGLLGCLLNGVLGI